MMTTPSAALKKVVIFLQNVAVAWAKATLGWVHDQHDSGCMELGQVWLGT